MPPEFLLGVDKLTAFVQPQLDSHRQGQQKLSGGAALPQQCLQIGKCHKDHLMHSICRHVWKYTKGILCKSPVRCCPEIFECLLELVFVGNICGFSSKFFCRQGKNLQAYFRMARIFRAIPHKDCATDASSNFSSDETKSGVNT